MAVASCSSLAFLLLIEVTEAGVGVLWLIDYGLLVVAVRLKGCGRLLLSCMANLLALI